MKIISFFLFLCVAPPGSAAVIYRATDIRLGSAIGGPYGEATREIDVDGDAVTDWAVEFTIRRLNRFISLTDTGNTRFVFQSINDFGGVDIVPLDGSVYLSSDLSQGGLLWMTNPSPVGFSLVRTSINDGGVFDPGPFEGLTAFLGFEFERLGQTHYGYAEVTGINGDGLIISALAWESEPGVGIRAGAIPEPSTFALLAVGFLGVLGRRKRQASL